LGELVARATRAQSPHNTQAWQWVATGTTLSLHADWERQLAVCDPDGREMIIGCGAALEHLLLLLGRHGTGVDLAVLPDPDNPDHLATVTVGGAGTYPDLPALVDAMEDRRTNRTAYRPDPIPEADLVTLRDAAGAFGVEVREVGDPGEREQVVELIMASDREQMADARFRRELSAWMRRGHEHATDGMPADLLGQHGVAAEVAPLVVRTFDVGKGQAARDGELVDGSPQLWVLATDDDTPGSWLACGRALARVTLEATARGIAHAYMNQPVEIPGRRVALAEALGVSGHPQLVVRMGYADPVHPSPRRPVDEVLTVT
jgi:hypothetical protein